MKKKPTYRRAKRSSEHTENANQQKVHTKGKLVIPPTQIMEFIERINDGFVALDAQMNYTYVNKRGGELLGRKPEDLIGKNYWEEYPEARGTPFANAYVRALETQTPILIEDYYSPWGRWFENRIYPSNDGITILFTEVTERKKAEQELREQNRFISALAGTTPGFVYIYDFQTNSNIYSNKGVENLLGYSAESVKSMGNELFGRLLHPDDIASVNASQVKLASANEKDTLEIEYRMRHANGDWHWFRSYERPFARQEDGSLKQKIGIALDITERKLAEEQVQRQVRRLNALRMIDIAISSSFDLKLVLNLVLQYILSQLGVDAGAVLLIKPHMQTAEYVANRGFQSAGMQRTEFKLNEGLASRAVAERRTIHLADVMRMDDKLAQSPQLANEEFVDYYGTPLMAKGEVKGVLEIYHRTHLNLDVEQLEFFETLAGQTAIAVDNAQLFNNLQNANMDLIMAYDATITGWSRAMDLRDKNMLGHTQRVTDLTLSLARAMKISESQLIHIRRGALLHDIGKIGVPDHILLKPDRLTDEEWKQMRRHPEFAYELLSPIQYLQPALDIPYCYHENWDGTGYPRGLKGDEIPLSARIFAIVNVWDILTSDRPYRSAWSRMQAIDFIREQSGRQFDPQVVEAFLQLIQEQFLETGE